MTTLDSAGCDLDVWLMPFPLRRRRQLAHINVFHPADVATLCLPYNLNVTGVQVHPGRVK